MGIKTSDRNVSASASFHEAPAELPAEVREMHRALASLIEELEAVDWYNQRVEASRDAELRGVLAHNRDEEKEHACMTLEWIRRQDPIFDRQLRLHLFKSQSDPIVDTEHDGAGHRELSAESRLGIGSLRDEEGLR